MINAHSVADLDGRRFGKHFLIPGDSVFSFTNIPRLLTELFLQSNVDPDKNSLCSKLIPGCDKEYKNVLVLFIDAFGWRFSSKVHEDPPAGFFKERAPHSCLTKLTSQFPSTTAVHVTTFHTGLTQRESGILEWAYYEASRNLAVNPLPFTVAATGRGASLGDDPSFLPESTLYPALEAAGVRSVSYTQDSYLSSPYNRRVLGCCEAIGHETSVEGLKRCCAFLQEQHEQRVYANVYFPELDLRCHRAGPTADETESVLQQLLGDISRHLLEPLSEGRGETLCLITADHGATDTFADRAVFVDRDQILPDHFYRCDQNGPLVAVGSPRNPFFYIKSQYVDEARKRLEDVCGGQAEVFATEELLELGAFGYGEPSQRFTENAPELIALPYPGESLFWKGPHGSYDKGFLGHHGGLTCEEMETTLWAFEL